MENGWFRGNPIKCGFTDHAKTIPVLAGTNIGEFDFGPVVPGKHEMNREEQIAFLTRKYGDATPELISLFEKAYPDKTIAGNDRIHSSEIGVYRSADLFLSVYL